MVKPPIILGSKSTSVPVYGDILSASTSRRNRRAGQQTADRQKANGPFVGGVQVLLGLVMLLSGASKLAEAQMHVQHFEQRD